MYLWSNYNFFSVTLPKYKYLFLYPDYLIPLYVFRHSSNPNVKESTLIWLVTPVLFFIQQNGCSRKRQKMHKCQSNAGAKGKVEYQSHWITLSGSNGYVDRISWLRCWNISTWPMSDNSLKPCWSGQKWLEFKALHMSNEGRKKKTSTECHCYT